MYIGTYLKYQKDEVANELLTNLEDGYDFP